MSETLPDPPAPPPSPAPPKERRMSEDPSTIARLASRARSHKEAANRSEAEVTRLTAELATANTKLVEANRAADADANRARAAKLEGQLREIKHKQAFAKAARDLGADPDLVDDLYAVSGYKPEGDEPDPEAVGVFVTGLKESKPKGYWLQEGTGDAPPPPLVRPSPSAGRGGPPPPVAGAVTEENLHDPIWVFENFNSVHKAHKEGRLQ